MSENIFEDVKFGDKFVTRDGRVALFIVKLNISKTKTCYRCIIEDEDDTFYDYDKNGLDVDSWYTELEDGTGIDVLGKWQEPVDDEELDKLAEEYIDDGYKGSDFTVHIKKEGQKEGFKAGYKKAKGL